MSEPRSSAPHEIERAEIHRERRREERQKEARTGCEVAAGKRHDRRPCARLDDNERDDQRERQYARGERATGLGQGRVVAPLSSSVAEAAAPEASGVEPAGSRSWCEPAASSRPSCGPGSSAALRSSSSSWPSSSYRSWSGSNRSCRSCRASGSARSDSGSAARSRAPCGARAPQPCTRARSARGTWRRRPPHRARPASGSRPWDSPSRRRWRAAGCSRRTTRRHDSRSSPSCPR